MDLETLKRRADAGEKIDFLFFWGHTQKKEGVVDKSCFSQWFPSPFVVDGERFPTAEHFMMHGKAMVFGDVEAAKRILSVDDPSNVKALGREVKGFDSARWETHRFEIVVNGNRAKFSQHEELKRFLLSTGASVIVEASPHDTIWGIGLKQSDDDAQDARRWRGLNLLGFALMKVRAELGGKD
jgi:ribA/ribD-fused uncharacterized protein